MTSFARDAFTRATRRVPSWPVDVVVAAFFLLAVPILGGPWEYASERFLGYPLLFAIALPAATAIAVARLFPGTAIGLIWLSGMFQIMALSDVLSVQAAAPIEAYGAARHGSRPVMWLGLASIGAGSIFAAFYLRAIYSGFNLDTWYIHPVTGDFVVEQRDWLVALVLASILLLPWMAGAVMRAMSRTHEARRQEKDAREEARVAQELAMWKATHAGLARDVHDIVGHSLAVIITQADSVAYIPDNDTPRIRDVTAHIAATARRSLLDIRNVLTKTSGRPTESLNHHVSVRELVATVEHAGRAVRLAEHGNPHTLPPHLSDIALNVTREMLTNALRHSTPHAPIRLTQSWTHRTYTITVENDTTEDRAGMRTGHGIDGMRQRLAEAQGVVSIEVEPQGETSRFIISAVIPLYPGEEIT